MNVEQQYQTLQRLRTVHLAQLQVIDNALAELDKERTPPVPRQRQNLKIEREAGIAMRMATHTAKKQKPINQ